MAVVCLEKVQSVCVSACGCACEWCVQCDVLTYHDSAQRWWPSFLQTGKGPSINSGTRRNSWKGQEVSVTQGPFTTQNEPKTA